MRLPGKGLQGCGRAYHWRNIDYRECRECEGGCRSKTARAVVHRVELVEAGGACETLPGR